MEYRYRDASEMKDSGVEWIGKIPKDWEICKVKYLCNIKSGEILSKTYFEDKGIYPIYGSNGIIGRTNKKNNSNKAIIIGRVGACGEVNIAKEGWITDNALILGINYRKVNFSYMAYVLKSCNLKDLSSGTAQPLITGSQIKNIQVLSIDIKKQEKIANFLDKKTSQFDSIISKKEALIEKLEEAKKSLISEVVTGKVKIVKTDDGYDLVKRSSDEMKDSGVEWVKEIPKHWDVINPKWMFSQRKDRAQEGDEQLTASQKHGIISQNDFMELENQKVVLVEKDFSILKHVEPNDFVRSMRSFQGGLEYSTIKGCISSAYVMLIPNERVYAPFFRWLFKSYKYINALQSTSNLIRDGQAMRYSNFIQIPLFKISKDEQKKLADYLDEAISNIDIILCNTRVQIKKLKEAKQSLISEAVTGKIEILD